MGWLESRADCSRSRPLLPSAELAVELYPHSAVPGECCPLRLFRGNAVNGKNLSETGEYASGEIILLLGAQNTQRVSCFVIPGEPASYLDTGAAGRDPESTPPPQDSSLSTRLRTGFRRNGENGTPGIRGSAVSAPTLVRLCPVFAGADINPERYAQRHDAFHYFTDEFLHALDFFLRHLEQ